MAVVATGCEKIVDVVGDGVEIRRRQIAEEGWGDRFLRGPVDSLRHVLKLKQL